MTPPRPVTFDLDDLSRRAGGDPELVLDIVKVFLEDCPTRLEEIGAAVARRDAAALRAAAHTLKGAASYLSARAVVDAALCLETLGKEGRVAETARVYEELRAHVAALVHDLQQLGDHQPSAGA